jgi:hypothetical protein
MTCMRKILCDSMQCPVRMTYFMIIHVTSSYGLPLSVFRCLHHVFVVNRSCFFVVHVSHCFECVFVCNANLLNLLV